MTLRTLGASVLSDLKGNLDLPRRTSRATATHLTETGTSTESSPTVDKLSLMPKRQGTYIEVSEMLLRQSSVDVENLIRLGSSAGCLGTSGGCSDKRQRYGS